MHICAGCARQPRPRFGATPIAIAQLSSSTQCERPCVANALCTPRHKNISSRMLISMRSNISYHDKYLYTYLYLREMHMHSHVHATDVLRQYKLKGSDRVHGCRSRLKTSPCRGLQKSERKELLPRQTPPMRLVAVQVVIEE